MIKVALQMKKRDVKIYYMTEVGCILSHVQSFASVLVGKILTCDYAVPSSGNNSVVSFGEKDG